MRRFRFPNSLAAVLTATAALLAPAVAQGGSRQNGPATPTASVIQTTATLSNALTAQAPLPFVRRPARGAKVIQVDPSVRYQRIIGFGAAMTDSSAWLLERELTPQQQASTMQSLFTPAGINLNFVRIPMGASDYVADVTPYSYDDLPAGAVDPELLDFSIGHDEPYILPALRAMLADNRRIFTLANPWSAPPWMKANQSFNNVGLLGNVLPRYYPALARYFVKFIQAYQAAGVPIDAITPMNEPDSGSGWPGTHLTPTDDATFIPKYLEPALLRARLAPGIYGPDNARFGQARALMSGPERDDISGAAFHCYSGMGFLSRFHAKYPFAPILLSECSPGIIPYATAEVPIDATRNWASGVQLWNLALDPSGGPVESNFSYGCPGCTGVVTVDEQTQSTIYNLNYYEFGQTSKYVQPGAVRIYSNRFVHDIGHRKGVTHGLDDVAFRNPDGSTVLVAYNSGVSPTAFSVRYHGRYLNWTLAPSATVTLVWGEPSGGERRSLRRP